MQVSTSNMHTLSCTMDFLKTNLCPSNQHCRLPTADSLVTTATALSPPGIHRWEVSHSVGGRRRRTWSYLRWQFIVTGFSSFVSILLYFQCLSSYSRQNVWLGSHSYVFEQCTTGVLPSDVTPGSTYMTSLVTTGIEVTGLVWFYLFIQISENLHLHFIHSPVFKIGKPVKKVLQPHTRPKGRVPSCTRSLHFHTVAKEFLNYSHKCTVMNLILFIVCVTLRLWDKTVKH